MEQTSATTPTAPAEPADNGQPVDEGQPLNTVQEAETPAETPAVPEVSVFAPEPEQLQLAEEAPPSEELLP